MNAYGSHALFHEPAREVPIVEHADVIVCGAGPAGVSAAIAAARCGAKTCLIETHGCLGGVWTAGLLAWILDSGNKTGLTQEIIARLEERGARQPIHWGGVAFDVEAMKLLLEEMCLEAGVHVRLHTRVVAAARDETNRLAVAITESKSGREAWAAQVFIDASGDGDLAAQAGCGFGLGRPSDGGTQPMSLLALLGGIELGDVTPWVHTKDKVWRADSQALLDTLAAKDVKPSYGAPVIFHIHDNLFAMMANHQYGASALDAQQITDATLQARREVNSIILALRAHGGPWQNLRLVATAEQIGVREGRRIRGRYQVTADDLIHGAIHEDAVCRVTFPVDVHSTDAEQGKTYGNDGVKAQPYDIPLRALIAKDVDGLMMAGRCISGDFLAHASYRVTGNAVAMGEASGACAALAAQQKILPHEVPWPEMEAALSKISELSTRNPA